MFGKDSASVPATAPKAELQGLQLQLLLTSSRVISAVGRGKQKPPLALREVSLVHCFFIALFVCIVAPFARSATITNVLPVNVTPSSFSILWRGPGSPSVSVFTDPAGATNISTQFEVDAFPLHTGNPDLAAGYDRRQSRVLIRQKTQSTGVVLMRVNGCLPNTTYYYRLSSNPTNSSPVVYPASGPLPSITTEKENTFVIDDQQLIIDVPGLDTLGRIVTLSNANSSHALAAVVGDGVGTNQVFFNVNDLFSLVGGGNFAPIGSQSFIADVLGPNQSESIAQFSLTFSTNFIAGRSTHSSIGTEFLAVSIGSTVLRAGQTTNVSVAINSSVGVSNLNLTLDLLPGRLNNFALQGLAPEIDTSSATVTPSGSSVLLHLPALPGQTISGTKQIGQFAFTAVSNQHSAFVPLKLTQITATKSDGSLVTNLFGQSGRAVVIDQESLLEIALGPNRTRILTLFGKPGSTYAIEYSTNLSSAFWNRLPYGIPLSTLSADIPGLNPAENQVFYRAVEFFADPPMVQALRAPDETRSLLIYGQSSRQYTVEYSTNLSNVTGWYPLLNTTLTNSFGRVSISNDNGIVFYRLRRN